MFKQLVSKSPFSKPGISEGDTVNDVPTQSSHSDLSHLNNSATPSNLNDEIEFGFHYTAKDNELEDTGIKNVVIVDELADIAGSQVNEVPIYAENSQKQSSIEESGASATTSKSTFSSFKRSIYKSFKSATSASESDYGIIKDSCLVAIGKQIIALENQVSAKREEYLEDFNALQRPILVEEVAALEKALQILEQRIELEASQGEDHIITLENELKDKLDCLESFKRKIFFPSSPVVLGQNGIYIAFDDIWLENLSSGYFTLEMTPRTNRNMKNPEIVIVLADTNSSNNIESLNGTNGTTSSSTTSTSSATNKKGMTIKMRLDGLKLAGEKGKNIPRLEWIVLDLAIVINARMTYDYDLTHHQWCSTPKNFKLEILSFRGPFGLSKSVVSPILSLLSPMLRRHILGQLPPELGELIQTFPSPFNIQGELHANGVDLSQLSVPIHHSTIVRDFISPTANAACAAAAAAAVSQLPAFAPVSTSVHTVNDASATASSINQTTMNNKNKSNDLQLNIHHKCLELFIDMQKSMERDGSSSSSSLSGSSSSSKSSLLKSMTDIITYHRNFSSNSKQWESIEVLWEQALCMYWKRMFPEEYSENIDEITDRKFLRFEHLLLIAKELMKERIQVNLTIRHLSGTMSVNQCIHYSNELLQRLASETLEASEDGGESTGSLLHSFQVNRDFTNVLLRYLTKKLDFLYLSLHGHVVSSPEANMHIQISDVTMQAPVSTKFMLTPLHDMSFLFSAGKDHFVPFATSVLPSHTGEVFVEMHQVDKMTSLVAASDSSSSSDSATQQTAGLPQSSMSKYICNGSNINTKQPKEKPKRKSSFLMVSVKSPSVSLVASQNIKLKAGSELFTMSLGTKEKGWRQLLGSDIEGAIRDDDSDNDDDEEEEGESSTPAEEGGAVIAVDDCVIPTASNQTLTTNNTTATTTATATATSTNHDKKSKNKCPVYLQTSYGIKSNTQIPHMELYIRVPELINFGASHLSDIVALTKYLETKYPGWEFLEDQIGLLKIVLLESVSKYLLRPGFDMEVNLRGKIVIQKNDIMITMETPTTSSDSLSHLSGTRDNTTNTPVTSSTVSSLPPAMTAAAAISINADFKMRDILEDLAALEVSLKDAIEEYSRQQKQQKYSTAAKPASAGSFEDNVAFSKQATLDEFVSNTY